MLNLWQDELTPEETDALIDKCVAAIKERSMELPAMMVLETHRPYGYLASNAAIMASPFLIPFFGFDKVNDYSRLFSKQENISKLLDRLESKDAQPSEDTSK